MHFKKLQQISFLALLVLVSIFFLYIIHDYLMPIFWAVVFAILFFPLQKRLVRFVKFRSFASIMTMLIMLVVIFVPLTVVGGLVFKESITIYQQISVTNTDGTVSVDLFDRFGKTFKFLESVGVSEVEARDKLASYAEGATKWLSGQVLSFGGKTFALTLQFFLMLYVLFFLLRDGSTAKKRLMEILPLGDKREERLIAKFVSTTRAVVKGTLIVGVVQGSLGGLLFSIAGIKGAALWGVFMTIVSVIPALGAIIVWLPAGLILLATGSVWQGIMILLVGALVISLIDNVLRPILVGRDTKMPDVIILISTLGGLSTFGLTGFVIGPILAGFFIVLWNMFEEEYHDDLLTTG